MDNQCMSIGPPNQHKKDKQVAARECLQEMFHGSIDREVVTLILAESDYNVEDAMEKLFTLNSNPVSTTEHVSYKPVAVECSDSPEIVMADGDLEGHPAVKTAYHKIDDIGIGRQYQPQKHVKPELSHVGQRLVNSGDSLLNSCMKPESHDLNIQPQCLQDGNSSEFLEPFKQLMENFRSSNPSSKEWNSVKTKQNDFFGTGLHEQKDLPFEQENLIAPAKLSQTINSFQIKSDTSVNDMNHKGSTTLPSWPDTNQFSHQHDSKPIHNHLKSFSHTPNPQHHNSYPQKHPRMISLAPNYRHPYQHFHPQAGNYNGPVVNQEFNVPHHQLPRHPMSRMGQMTNSHGFAPHNNYTQPNVRKPPYRLPRGKVLVIMRGLPGSGKSTFAQSIKGTGVVYSTDEYFLRNGQYQFDVAVLGEAHEWNQLRAREAMQVGVSPVIIDNTNSQAWEMKPYASMAQRLGYQVILKEPETSWRWNAKELFRRNQHGVSLSGIKNMMERYEHNLTLDHISKSTFMNKKPDEESADPSAKQQTENKPDLSDAKTHIGNDKSDQENNKEKQQNIIDQRNFPKKFRSNYSFNQREEGNKKSAQAKTEEAKYQTQHEKYSEHSAQGKQQVNRQSINRYSPQRDAITKPIQDASVMRSHGSRSPVREFEKYMADERHAGILTENQKGSSPKPQRKPRRRERRTVEQENPRKDPEIYLSDTDQENPSKEQEIYLSDAEQENPSKEQEIYLSDAEQENTREEPEMCLSNTYVDVNGKPNSQSVSSGRAVEMVSGGLKVSSESDIDIEVDNRESSSQLSTHKSTTDDAYCSDDENSDDVIVEMDDVNHRVSNKDFTITQLPASLLTRKITSQREAREEAEREEKLSQNVHSSEPTDLELSGIEFLNTCFPDIDDMILLGILSGHDGNVNKAIETILGNNERFIGGETKHQSESSNGSTSDGSVDDATPSQAMNQQYETLPTPTCSPTSFQMSLEPAIAFHLFELFGPIQGVDFKGEFSASDLSLTVDKEFSKLLYLQWKKSIQTRGEGVVNKESTAKQVRSPNSQKYRTRLQLHEPLPPPPQKRIQPSDLREIMHEQHVVEKSRREQEKQKPNMAVILKRQKLYAMFPGVDPTALEELFEANKYELQPTIAMVQTSCNIEGKPTALLQDEKANDDDEDWTSLLATGTSQKRYQALEDPGYLDFRGEANMHYKLRDECFKKAALAFSQKQGQLAQFYAAQGHSHTEKIKEANKRAASLILEQKNADRDKSVLDLHGLHVAEALQALQERLDLQDFTHKTRSISVVTGRGLHSKQGKAKIKPAVLKYLQDHNYRHEEMHAGQIKVYLK